MSLLEAVYDEVRFGDNLRLSNVSASPRRLRRSFLRLRGLGNKRCFEIAWTSC